MKNFYETYAEDEKLAPLVREIGWSHNVIIFEKCKDNLQREFYIRMTRLRGWTKAILTEQIRNQAYEKFLLNQTNFDTTIPEENRLQAKLAVKDEYTFGFLELADDYTEHQLELAILKDIRAFLIEMGGDFAFIGNQFRLAVGGKDYSLDLLLYHRRLQCLVAIDLKIGAFTPEHKGKMDFYLTALNEQVKLPEENDSIGIIICQTKNKTIVEYALKTATQPVGVATYTTTAELPADYQGLLPTGEEIRERIGALEWVKKAAAQKK